MRRNLTKIMGLMVLVLLLMPAGMLFAKAINQPPAVTSSNANWYDVEEASNLLNQMQNLALKVRRSAARIQVQELQLGWQEQTYKLATVKSDIDTIGNDLVRLDHIKSELEPWQQSLLHKITPELHEMVYQTDDALNTIGARENRDVLALTQYPGNINVLYMNANQMADTIGTVTQYAHAEENMAALKHNIGTAHS